MNLLTDFIHFPFLQRALIGALLLSLACGALSPMLVAKRFAFMGPSVAHGALLGVSLALALGPGQNINQSTQEIGPSLWIFLVTTGVTLLAATPLALTTFRQKLPSDALIGLFFTATMSLGLLIHHALGPGKGDLLSYLFGNILMLGTFDLWALALLTLFIILGVWPFRLRWILFLYDEQSASIQGLRTKIYHLGLFFILTLIIVSGLKISGVILINSFLLIPGIFALKFSPSARKTFLYSTLFCLFTTLWGLLGANALDLPMGPSLALTQVAFYLIAQLFFLLPLKKRPPMPSLFLLMTFLTPLFWSSPCHGREGGKIHKIHMDANAPEDIQRDFKKEDFRPYMLDHYNEGCPTNSSCSKEMGKIYKEWIKALKRSDRSSRPEKILESFRLRHGIPFDIWLLDTEKVYPRLISWQGPCKIHNGKEKRKVRTALGFIKNISDFKELQRKGIISIRTMYRKKFSGALLSYPIPLGETPLYLTEKEAIFQRGEQGYYYALSIDEKGSLRTISPQTPPRFPERIPCSPKLQKEIQEKVQHLFAQRKRGIFDPSLYAGLLCQRTWDIKSKHFDTLLFGWSCD